MRKYKVKLSNGTVIDVPDDKARSKYEYISDYGLQAVLERARRTKAYTATNGAGEYIATIICPNGEEITQF